MQNIKLRYDDNWQRIIYGVEREEGEGGNKRNHKYLKIRLTNVENILESLVHCGLQFYDSHAKAVKL